MPVLARDRVLPFAFHLAVECWIPPCPPLRGSLVTRVQAADLAKEVGACVYPHKSGGNQRRRNLAAT